MRLYFAGPGGWWPCLQGIAGGEGPGILFSYLDVRQGGKDMEWARTFRDQGVDLFLDSGAFTAATKGTHIDVLEFRDFVLETREMWETVAALDVIGDHVATAANTRVMTDAGITSLPTFHPLEPFERLREMVQEFPRFALGGIAGRTGGGLERFLADCWRTIRDEVGDGDLPDVHAFGITRQRWITGFPWGSIDSTAWLSSKFGRIYTQDRSGYRGVRVQVKKSGKGTNARQVSRLISKATPPVGAKKEEYHPAVIQSAQALRDMVDQVTRLQVRQGVT